MGESFQAFAFLHISENMQFSESDSDSHSWYVCVFVYANPHI